MRSHFLRVALIGLAALGAAVILVAHPPAFLMLAPAEPATVRTPASIISALPEAFGISGQVRLQLRLPGELFDYPMQLSDSAAPIEYAWVRARDSSMLVAPRRWARGTVAAPPLAGFYRLAVTYPDGHHDVDSVIVGVMVPFSSKMGASLNGYRIGTYGWERTGGVGTLPPRGFVEVFPENAELAVSTHFRLADFLTHDGQEHWPRYLALDPRILDKVELVLRQLGMENRKMRLNVNSGFRTPLYNQRVPRAASDSRHQYGDAADLAIDVDGDGRVTYLDGLSIARAVEAVERDHPELVGGLGLYGYRGTAAYVHIDVRGTRVRWRG